MRSFFLFLRHVFFGERWRTFWYRLGQVFFALFLIFLFFPLKLRVVELPVFASGTFHSYAAFFLYAGDPFFVMSLVFLSLHFVLFPDDARRLRFGSRFLWYFWILLLAILEVSLFFSSSVQASFFFCVRWVQVACVYFYFVNEVLPWATVWKIFVFGFVGEAMMGMLQYVGGEGLGLSWLGEPILNTSMAGVAKVRTETATFLRAYGTFPHPNMYAAYAIVAVFGVYGFYKRNPVAYRVIGFFLFLGLLFSFSRMAVFAFALGTSVFLLFAKRFFSRNTVLVFGSVLVLFFGTFHLAGPYISRARFDDTDAVAYRAVNTLDGVRLFAAAPAGRGGGTASLDMQSVSNDKISPWQFEPPHNVFLAVADDLGAIGLLLWIALFIFLAIRLWATRRAYPHVFALFLVFFLLSFSDHYWYALYHGQILFALVLSVFDVILRAGDAPRSLSDSR